MNFLSTPVPSPRIMKEGFRGSGRKCLSKLLSMPTGSCASHLLASVLAFGWQSGSTSRPPGIFACRRILQRLIQARVFRMAPRPSSSPLRPSPSPRRTTVAPSFEGRSWCDRRVGHRTEGLLSESGREGGETFPGSPVDSLAPHGAKRKCIASLLRFQGDVSVAQPLPASVDRKKDAKQLGWFPLRRRPSDRKELADAECTDATGAKEKVKRHGAQRIARFRTFALRWNHPGGGPCGVWGGKRAI